MNYIIYYFILYYAAGYKRGGRDCGKAGIILAA
jgi:hypothetical protein